MVAFLFSKSVMILVFVFTKFTVYGGFDFIFQEKIRNAEEMF